MKLTRFTKIMKDHRIAVPIWIICAALAFELETGAAAAQSLPGIGIVMTWAMAVGPCRGVCGCYRPKMNARARRSADLRASGRP